MVYKRRLSLAAALFCSAARGDPALANFRWRRPRPATSVSQRPRLPSSSQPDVQSQPGKSAAAGGTGSTSAPRRRANPPQGLPPSGAANVTRVLLPLVPLLAELPALTAHARAARPWARATVAACAAAAFARRPLAFTAPLAPCRPLRRQQRQRQRQQRAVAPRQRLRARRRCSGGGGGRMQQETHARRRSASTVVSRSRSSSSLDGGAGGVNLSGDGDGDSGKVGRCPEEHRSPTIPIIISGAPTPPSPFSPVRPPPSSRSYDGPPPSTRRGAIEKALVTAARWVAGAAAAAVAGSTVSGSGPPAAVYADDGAGSEQRKGGGGGGGNGGEDSERFGSKAFTKKSYDGFADGYDDLDGGWAASAIGTEELRAQLLERAAGRVLEVGVGTGLNLRHYRRDAVSAIDAVDLSPGMLGQASSRIESLGMKGLVKLSAMDVEHLEFPSRTFDTVVDTFSLCVFSNPSAALREMARVCKPQGRVLLLENSKSEFGPLAAYQDLTASYLADRGGAKGCFWNQDVEALCRAAGLTVVQSSPALPGGLFRTLECVPAGQT